MAKRATEYEKRAVRVLCDFGQGLKDAGTGVAIRDGVVLTARHVLYTGDCIAKSIALRWTYSSVQKDPTPAHMPDGCECPVYDIAVLTSDAPPPDDIASLPCVRFAEHVPHGTELWGDGFPILTDTSASGGVLGEFTLKCEVLGSKKGFMKLDSNERSRFSAKFMRNSTSEEIDLAFAGASGTGLFDANGMLAAIFLARDSANVTDKRAAYISDALEKFRHVLVKPIECERIDEEIERLVSTIPEFQGLAEMETLSALEVIEQTISERTRVASQRLACLLVARGCDRDEIRQIQSLLDDRAKVIDVHTTRFGGVECRMAGAEDRPVAWREMKADPVAEYRLADAPDNGIDGTMQGTDFIGAIGMDLNHRFDDPFAGVPEEGQMAVLMEEVIYELSMRHEESRPRYYYAARHDARQIDVYMDQLADHFKGLIPFFRMQVPQDAKHDRAILRSLLNIIKWKPSP